MDKLPNELVRMVRDYVYRFDWRTCKKREASLVTSLFKAAREAVWLDDEEKNEWTLFGLWYLISLPHKFHYALGRPPLIPPQDKYYRDDYKGSYIHRIQWING
jgi:hypothetical protein